MKRANRHHVAHFCSIAWFSILLSHDVAAFSTGSINVVPAGTSKYNRRHSSRFAKPPPTSRFDLDAIEAFEAQIEMQARASIQTDTGNVDDDDDWIEDDDFAAGNDDAASVQEFTVPMELHNKRIDAVIAELIPHLSRSTCGDLVLAGNVQDISGTIINRKSQKVEAGTFLRVTIPNEEKPLEIKPQNLPINILYEDEHMIVLNKEAGMVVHPAAGNWDGTVLNALAYYLSSSPFGSGEFLGEDGMTINPIQGSSDGDGEALSCRPGIVHRLDKGTTGVLVVAKTSQALSLLSEAFASRKAKKTYLAITVGNPGSGVVIDKPIGRHPIHRQRMRVVPDPHRKDSSGSSPSDRLSSTVLQKGRRALSYVDTLAFDGKLSLVKVRIETGRTHQIRVHLQDRRTPIYGDDLYGISDWNKRLVRMYGIERPLLHAHRLEIDHPITGEHMVFMAPMPDDLRKMAINIWPLGPVEVPDLFRVT